MSPAARRLRLVVLACVLVGLLPSAAVAGSRPTVFQSRHLWATVDVCNTSAHPRTIGIRGSMPGSGIAGERMFMRFRVQYRATPTGAWAYIGTSADSGFVAVGSARYKARQAGRSFELAGAKAQAYVLRGVVSFEWRHGARVVRSAQKATTAGHMALAGSDPPGYSAAGCEIA